MAGPANLIELYGEASADVGETLATWAFRLAKARGRVVVAEKALAHLQALQRDAHLAAFGVAYNESMKAAVLATEPHPTTLGNAVDALTEAVEWCSACETVLRLLEARPANAAPLRTVQGEAMKGNGTVRALGVGYIPVNFRDGAGPKSPAAAIRRARLEAAILRLKYAREGKR